MSTEASSTEQQSFGRGRTLVLALGILTVVTFVFVTSLARIVLLVFAGILMAVFLDAASSWVSARSPLSRRAALAVVIIVMLALLALLGWFTAPALSAQWERLSGMLADSQRELQQELGNLNLWDRLVEQLGSISSGLFSGGGLVTEFTGIFSSTLGLLADIGIVVFVGFYLAVSPQVYVEGAVKLFPVPKRDKARRMFRLLGSTLRWWLLGRFASMAIVGVLSLIGLMVLGVPLALLLGTLAGILAFIPIIGPILAVIPAALIALATSPQQALYVVLLYGGIQFVENYFITPVIQERAVSLPPALTVVSQAVAAVFAGSLGVALAQPIAAIALVLVRKLYVEEMLHDVEAGAEASTG